MLFWLLCCAQEDVELPDWNDLVTFVEEKLRASPAKKKSSTRARQASKSTVLDLENEGTYACSPHAVSALLLFHCFPQV